MISVGPVQAPYQVSRMGRIAQRPLSSWGLGRSLPDDGEELAARALRRTLEGARCPRCGLIPGPTDDNPIPGHDGPASKPYSFCPAFSRFGEAGHWIQFNTIAQSIRTWTRRIHHWLPTLYEAGQIEDHDQRFGAWHTVMGVAMDSQYLLRMDAPAMPEFSIFRPDRGLHTVIYRGWRSAVPRVCSSLRIPWRHVAKDLGVSPDRPSEEIRRWEAGWL